MTNVASYQITLSATFVYDVATLEDAEEMAVKELMDHIREFGSYPFDILEDE